MKYGKIGRKANCPESAKRFPLQIVNIKTPPRVLHIGLAPLDTNIAPPPYTYHSQNLPQCHEDVAVI
jgi:hypothetical protein